MPVPRSKKRYQLALDEENVNEFRKVAASLGFPKSVMSAICNEAIKKTCAIFKKAKQKNGLTMIDLFSMVGEEMEAMNDEKQSHETTGLEKKPRR